MTGRWRPAIPWSDYGVAVGTVALGGLLTLLLWPLMRQMPFAWFFAAVMVSSWRGGLGPGVCATVLATMMSSALLFPSFSALLVTSSEEHNRLAVFLLIALMMSFLNGSRKRVEGTLRESEARFRLMADLCERSEIARFGEVAGDTERRHGLPVVQQIGARQHDHGHLRQVRLRLADCP